MSGREFGQQRSSEAKEKAKKEKAEAFDNAGFKENWSPSLGIPLIFNSNPLKFKLSTLKLSILLQKWTP